MGATANTMATVAAESSTTSAVDSTSGFETSETETAADVACDPGAFIDSVFIQGIEPAAKFQAAIEAALTEGEIAYLANLDWSKVSTGLLLEDPAMIKLLIAIEPHADAYKEEHGCTQWRAQADEVFGAALNWVEAHLASLGGVIVIAAVCVLSSPACLTGLGIGIGLALLSDGNAAELTPGGYADPELFKAFGCGVGMRLIAGGVLSGEILAPYCMDTKEVTMAEFLGVNANPGTAAEMQFSPDCNAMHVGDRDQHPINCVTRTEAINHCLAVGKRLPTKSEWYWAARGREEARVYPWGGETCDHVAYCTHAVVDNGCGEGRTWPVGSKPAGNSRDDLMDMVGNVVEWTSTVEDENYYKMGGSWTETADSFSCVFILYSSPPELRKPSIGFRCVRDFAG